MSPYTGDLVGGCGLGRTAMSTTELRRAGILARVAAGTLTLGAAATLMDLSYRQAKRLYRRYRSEGAKGLKHRSAGRASNRVTDTQTRRRVLALIREKYSGGADERFGPTLAAEHLASEDGIAVDHETLRRWMLAAGLWSRARKRSPHRRRRARMAHFGELVQLDGSFHPWFEDRGPHSCLLTLVDDATGGAWDDSARRRRFGPPSRSSAPGLPSMAFRGRSTRIGRTCMCDGRIRRSARPAPNR